MYRWLLRSRHKSPSSKSRKPKASFGLPTISPGAIPDRAQQRCGEILASLCVHCDLRSAGTSRRLKCTLMAVYSQDIPLSYGLERLIVDIYKLLTSITGFCGCKSEIYQKRVVSSELTLPMYQGTKHNFMYRCRI